MFQKIGSLGTDNPQLDEIIASKSAGHHLSYCFVSKTIYLNSHIFCLIGITVLIQPYRNLIFMQTREHFNWFPSQQTAGSCDSRTLYRVEDNCKQSGSTVSSSVTGEQLSLGSFKNIPLLIKPLSNLSDSMTMACHTMKKPKKN